MEIDEEICSDNSDDFISDNEENELLSEPTTCLFCSDVQKTIDLAIFHLKDAHKIDLRSLKIKFRMDQYSYIKLINYIRINNVNSEIIESTETILWNDDKYLKPLEYEPWLSYDFEELPCIDDSQPSESNINNVSPEKYFEMERMMKNLLEKNKEKDVLLQESAENIEKMRTLLQRFVEKDHDSSESNSKSRNSVASVSLAKDESYFSSYAHFGIHHEMLSDTVRTETYRNAILNNSKFLSGKLVLDVGCGTSVLSMFAAQAGASEVIAIDNSEIIYNAMEIVRKNNFKNIKFVKGRLEDTELPIDKFDIIISEWMGYFLIFEGMLDSIIYARDRHLKTDGTIMPNRCTISLAGYGDIKRHSELITFWDSVYGFDMSSMKTDVLHEPLIEICKPEFILTDSNVIANYDLSTVNLNYSNFEYNFELNCKKNGKLTSFIGYFDTFFDLPNSVHFSTSPNDTPTHWKQVVFFLEHPIEIEKNQKIIGKFECKRCKSDLRSLDIKIIVFNKEYNYYLD